MKWFDNRLLYVVITTAISGYFSPSNKEPFRCKCDKFSKYLKNDMVDTALRSNNTQGLSNERKVMLFCMQQSQGVEALQMLIGGFVAFMVPQVVGSMVILLELAAVMLRQVWYI